MRDWLIRNLVRIDGMAGLTAGVHMLLMLPWLSTLYALPSGILLCNAIANIVYGAFSSTLSVLPKRPVYLVMMLSLANCLWAGVCLVFLFTIPETATVFAAGHAAFEAMFVGTLGVMEWRLRHQLAIPPTSRS